MTDDDRLDRLRRALASLDPLTRQVFLAHVVEDLPYGVIAGRFGIDVDLVERHVARALVALSGD